MIVAQTIESGWVSQAKPRGRWEWGRVKATNPHHQMQCYRVIILRVVMATGGRRNGRLAWKIHSEGDWFTQRYKAVRQIDYDYAFFDGIERDSLVTAPQAAHLTGIRSQVAMDKLMDTYDA